MSRTKSESKKKKTPSSSIPTVLTSFIGRKHELAEIVHLLESSRVLTLTGAAGCGKTRLALRIATEINDQYEDGIYWVELARLTNDRLIPKLWQEC
jgi:non-specific serine/threonine protein kinase